MVPSHMANKKSKDGQEGVSRWSQEKGSMSEDVKLSSGMWASNWSGKRKKMEEERMKGSKR